VAKDYAGGVYNAGTPQGPVTVSVNGSGYGTADYSDGGNPCDRRTSGDWISPPPVEWTDVKVQETDIPTFFGTFGVPVPAITARARVELRPAESDNLFIPLGIPNPAILKAEAKFFNSCVAEGQPGYFLTLSNGQTKVDLTQLADQSQAPPLTTLWGPSGGSNLSINTLSSQLGPMCQGGATNGWIPIGVEIRLAGRAGVDIDGPSCSTLHQNTLAARFADCYSDPAMIRAWDGADPTIGPPVFNDVKLFNGSPLCKYDPHFTRVTPPACSFGGRVNVLWGDRPGALSDTSHVSYSLTLNGVPLTPDQAGKDGDWSVGSGLNPAASDVQPISVAWSWSDTNPADSWKGNACNDDNPPNKNPCKGSGGPLVVQRAFTGTDNNAGIVQLLQLATSGVGTGAVLFDSVAHDGSPSFNLNVGLQAAFKPDTTTTSPLTTLRQSASQGNQSLNCNTQNQGDDFEEYSTGCTKFYSTNTYALADTPASPVTNNPWWQGTPHSCPDGNTIWGIANSSGSPWLCVATAPGASPDTIACAMAFRTGNWSGAPPNNNCGQNDLSCVHPNRYADYVAGTEPAGDPRVVKVFVVPFGAFKGATGASNDATVPIFDFAAFYITGWGAQGNKTDPCLSPPSGSTPDDAAAPGEIVGHFVKWEGPNVSPVDPNQDCLLDQLRPCRAVQVR
jgi:hypothetical protein